MIWRARASLRSRRNVSTARRHRSTAGNLLAHYLDWRVYLRKGKNNQRIAKLYAGPRAETEATFAITNAGIVDADA